MLSVLLFVLGVLSLVTGLSAIVASSVKLLPATLNLFRILNPELFVQPVVAALRRRDPGCLYISLVHSPQSTITARGLYIFKFHNAEGQERRL